MVIAIPLALLISIAPLIVAVTPPVGTAVRGQVLDDRRQPVAGATVTFEARDTTHIRVVVTDAAGRFEIDAMDVGRHVVQVQHPFYRVATLPHDFGGSDSDMSISLIRR